MSFCAQIVRYFGRQRIPLRGGADVLRRLNLVFVLLAMFFGAAKSATAQVELPQADPRYPIAFSAVRAHRWTEGAYEVWWLEGDCRIEQGHSRASAEQAMLWIDHGGAPGEPSHKIIAYLSGGVVIDRFANPLTQPAAGLNPHEPLTTGRAPDQPASQTLVSAQSGENIPIARLEDATWFGRMYSIAPPQARVAGAQGEPEVKPAVYHQAMALRKPRPEALQQVQFETPVEGASQQVPPGFRRILVTPRGDGVGQIQSFVDPNTNETIGIVNFGVNIVIDGATGLGDRIEISGPIDISTDRMVIWTAQGTDLAGPTSQPADAPLELYLEGNVVFREGDRILQAKAMYYNVTLRHGVILDCELLTPVPQYEGLVRLRADVLRQVNRDTFVADRGSVTTSRIGVPTYEMRSGSLLFQDVQQPVIDPFTGVIQTDERGAPETRHDQLVSGTNNVLSIEGVPVFYWPYFAADLQRPPLYIDSVAFRNDRVFGNQVLLDLDMYQILAIREPPEGTEWIGSLDYMSMRGFGGGTTFTYDRRDFFGLPGHYHGFVDAWYINDHGLDNLGRARRSLAFPHAFRGRTLIRHWQELPNDWLLRFEFGQVTDRNFLEQYYEQEWDERKDQVTRLSLYRIWDNQSLDLSLSTLINPYFTQTQDLPELNHYWLGQPLLDDVLTLYSHSSIGYLRQNLAEVPFQTATNDNDFDQFHYLPYDTNVKGERIATRHEIDWPFQLGAVKIVPYLLGEAAHWGEAYDGQPDDRVYGQAGVRASMPMWSVDPTVESTLWNVHGVAHKVVFDMDFSYTDSSRNLDELAIYDEIDDDNIQAFRRRFGFEIYDTMIPAPDVFAVPLKFDERFYGVRRGTQDWVTGPTEIADDLTVFRLGAYQRWQTKRGMPGQRRIMDWIVLNTEMEIFPKPEQNFDQAAGLFDYDFQWFVGDRLTLLSYGGFDFFNEGQKWATFGGFINRPPRGSLFLGFNAFEGPIHANVMTISYTYRMSPKWFSTFGTSFDVQQENIGQNFRLTRIGESFLFVVGMNVDASRDNVGFTVSLVPRFMGRSRAANSLAVGPAGLYGLE